MPSIPPATPRPDADQFAGVEELLAHFERIEAQFQKVRDGLTHSHRLATLGTIASIVAHEYNNILTPIISYAQLALATPDDRELMVKALEKSLSGAEKAARISSSILGFAREEGGDGEASLREAVEETLACMARPPEKDGIELRLDLPDTRVAMSPVALQQVLLNLLLNARKAMRGRGGALRITGALRDDTLHLSVADSGPGIPPEVLGSLFEPFVTQPTENGAPRGTGLGLCICRDLVQHAGGTIRAESRPGEGATFHLTLPLAGD